MPSKAANKFAIYSVKEHRGISIENAGVPLTNHHIKNRHLKKRKSSTSSHRNINKQLLKS